MSEVSHVYCAASRGGFTLKLMKPQLLGPSLAWAFSNALGGALNKYSLS